MGKVRYIKLFKSYYKDFYVAQTDVVRHKINFVLKLVETQRIIPKKFLGLLKVLMGFTKLEWKWRVISTAYSVVWMRGLL